MPTLNKPQARFLALPQKFRLYVAGFGSGKTWAGSSALCQHFWEWPKVNAGYFAPTYPLIRDVFYPTIEEVAHDWGLRVDIHESNKEIAVYGAGYRGTIICRSMEKPGSIVGFKIGKALVDELDTLANKKAGDAWRKIIARMRVQKDGLQNGIDVTTTPEGFKFVYEQWVKQPRERAALADMYGMVKASTYENAKNLPKDYIPSLLASYSPELIKAYLRGEFVNLTSGSVYPGFDRALNRTTETIRPGEALHVGMDFNVLNMTAVVHVIREGRPLALAEHVKIRDTPQMAQVLKDRYAANHTITVYPDASGDNTSSKNASESDLTILRQAGFSIVVNDSNPRVRDRINAMGAMILNEAGERRWLINTDACPVTTEAFEQQAYAASGEPDKTSGHDHPPDATGYFIVKRWPIVRPVASVSTLRL